MGFFTSESESKSTVTPYDESGLQSILGRLRTLGETPIEMYPEQMYAGMDPLQQEALGMREQYARGLGGVVDPAMQAWRSTLMAPDVANNPYVQGMLEQQANLLNRNLMENLIPGAEMGAIGAGQFGGSRQGIAEGIAMRGTQEALANQAAQTQMDAYLSGLQQQRYGLSAAPGMASFGMMPADILAGVGGTLRSEDQMGINEAIQRWNFAQQEPWTRLQNQAALYQPLTLPFAETETQAKYRPSALQNIGQVVDMASNLIGAFTGGGTGSDPYQQQVTAQPTPSPQYGGGFGGYQNPFTSQSFGFQGMLPYQSRYI